MNTTEAHEIIDTLARYYPRSVWIPDEGEQPDAILLELVRSIARLDESQGQAIASKIVNTHGSKAGQSRSAITIAEIRSYFAPALEQLAGMERNRFGGGPKAEAPAPEVTDESYAKSRRDYAQRGQEAFARVATAKPDAEERERFLQAIAGDISTFAQEAWTRRTKTADPLTSMFVSHVAIEAAERLEA